jgi:hypothetical protein
MPAAKRPPRAPIPELIVATPSNGEDALVQLEKIRAAKAQIKKDNLIFFFKPGDIWYPNPLQQTLIDAWKDTRWKVFVASGSNRRGKTTAAVILAYCVMFGEWPWSGEKIPFPHNDPRLILYVGQGWESHIQKVVEPELIKLWPKSRGAVSDVTKKNNQGIRAFWEDPVTKSQLHIGSNNQEVDAFEGPKWDLIIWDEPPSRNVRVAAARGLVDRNGRELFVATLVKEAWVHKEVIKARDENGKPDTSVFHIDGDIYDNVSRCQCGKYILRTLQRPGGLIIGICPDHGEQEEFDRRGLTLEGVEQFKKTLRKDEIESRINGRPSYLADLVLTNFDRNRNCRPRITKLPLNWVFDVSIDFHPAKPWAVLFMGTDQKNFKYLTHCLELRGGPNSVGDEIVRLIHDNHMYINSITIDPLSKGDENSHEVGEVNTTFKKLEEKFAAYGYVLEVASKDKTNGISLTNDLLLTENEMPSLFIFDDMGQVIEQLEGWMRDPDTLLPSKKNPDEWGELLYRLVLKNTQWYDHLNISLDNLSGYDKNEEVYDPLGRR